ncbi:MAG: hypothetical protein DRO11_07060, partial [Methanobacteriota archaeon]
LMLGVVKYFGMRQKIRPRRVLDEAEIGEDIKNPLMIRRLGKLLQDFWTIHKNKIDDFISVRKRKKELKSLHWFIFLPYS